MVWPDVRLPRVVANAALIAVLAPVVVPGIVGSHIPSGPSTFDPAAFGEVRFGGAETAMTTPVLDPDLASEGSLIADAALREPGLVLPGTAAARPGHLPATKAIIQIIWHLDNNISWYGPGFYGVNHKGACGMFGADGFQNNDVGVAHRTLPCGTRVTFRYNGVTVTTRVVDRGPYVAGRTWDMTRGLCELLHHCFTGGGVYWHLG